MIYLIFFLFNLNLINSLNYNLPLPLYTHHLQHISSLYKYKRKLEEGSSITPLFIGYGTHISYIYVGNPSQRQSVIIDTGSSATAFPCTVSLLNYILFIFFYSFF